MSTALRRHRGAHICCKVPVIKSLSGRAPPQRSSSIQQAADRCITQGLQDGPRGRNAQVWLQVALHTRSVATQHVPLRLPVPLPVSTGNSQNSKVILYARTCMLTCQNKWRRELGLRPWSRFMPKCGEWSVNWPPPSPFTSPQRLMMCIVPHMVRVLCFSPSFYQLLHRTASAIIEARRFLTAHAVARSLFQPG